MAVAQPPLAFPTWLRFPRRTARLRLTALYGGLFLVSGAVLLAITYVLFEQATKYRRPHIPTIPQIPAITQVGPNLAQAQYQLGLAQSGLPLSQHQLPLQRLTQADHQLSQARHQLALAVHQLAQTGPVEAAQRASDLHQLLVNSGIALGIVAVLALVAGWLVAGRMLRPIRTITRTARRISSTSLHERLALDGPKDELKELGDTLDDLFGRLHAAFDAQRHFVANASHELRTPLTAERTLLQVALDDPATTSDEWRSTAKEVLASTDEQGGLIEGLLTLASSEGGLERREPIDLSTVVEEAFVACRPEVDRLDLQVATALAPAPLEGDARLVDRLVVNLIDNAVGHNVVGGHIRISTAMGEGNAALSVDNTGPVIPPAEVGRLFQPFQRLDPGRRHHKEGHGLGLSIVEAIASAHGATITAHAPSEGGLSINVVFPPPGRLDAGDDKGPRSQRRPAGRPRLSLRLKGRGVTKARPLTGP